MQQGPAGAIHTVTYAAGITVGVHSSQGPGGAGVGKGRVRMEIRQVVWA